MHQIKPGLLLPCPSPQDHHFHSSNLTEHLSSNLPFPLQSNQHIHPQLPGIDPGVPGPSLPPHRISPMQDSWVRASQQLHGPHCPSPWPGGINTSRSWSFGFLHQKGQERILALLGWPRVEVGSSVCGAPSPSLEPSTEQSLGHQPL